MFLPTLGVMGHIDLIERQPHIIRTRGSRVLCQTNVKIVFLQARVATHHHRGGQHAAAMGAMSILVRNILWQRHTCQRVGDKAPIGLAIHFNAA